MKLMAAMHGEGPFTHLGGLRVAGAWKGGYSPCRMVKKARFKGGL